MIFLFVPAILVPAFAGEKIRVVLVGMDLTLKKAGRESHVPVTEVERIRLGDEIGIDKGKACCNGKDGQLVRIDLTVKDKEGRQSHMEVKEAEKIRSGEKVVIQDGKAKKRGKGRGC